MPNPDIVTYLEANLNKFPVDALRLQLAQEGVSDAEFDEALQFVLRNKKPAAKKTVDRAKFGRLMMALGGIVVLVAILVLIGREPSAPPVKPVAASQDGVFMGRSGYVIRLPQDYGAVREFRDPEKKDEVVYFCKAGTDPGNFLNEGLYGQLGIVRLEVQPSAYAGRPDGVEALTAAIAGRAQERGEKFTTKPLQVESLRGVQLNYDAPFPRLEAYILGRDMLYAFTAGQDDEVYREIALSLRDTHSEN